MICSTDDANTNAVNLVQIKVEADKRSSWVVLKLVPVLNLKLILHNFMMTCVPVTLTQI